MPKLVPLFGLPDMTSVIANTEYLNWEQFWSHLHLYATVVSKDKDDPSKTNFEHIPFTQCKNKEWVKDIKNKDLKEKAEKYGICLDTICFTKINQSRSYLN